MHQVTNISYGEGTVNIVLDSSSQMEVVAPDFRFADYSSVVTACFTPKELDRISEGNSAEITFYFVVTDEIEDELLKSQYYDAIEQNETVIGNLNEGVLIDVAAKKVIGDDVPTDLVSCAEDVELQMDIPLFLIKEDRSYFVLADNRGEFVLMSDATPDADVLTLKTHSFVPGILLYQDPKESLLEKKDTGFRLDMRQVLFGGIVVLAVLWVFIDYMHKKSE